MPTFRAATRAWLEANVGPATSFVAPAWSYGEGALRAAEEREVGRRLLALHDDHVLPGVGDRRAVGVGHEGYYENPGVGERVYDGCAVARAAVVEIPPVVDARRGVVDREGDRLAGDVRAQRRVAS